jgi:hypothetical protein
MVNYLSDVLRIGLCMQVLLQSQSATYLFVQGERCPASLSHANLGRAHRVGKKMPLRASRLPHQGCCQRGHHWLEDALLLAQGLEGQKQS